MRLTYKTLGALIECMDESQLNCDVTVELAFGDDEPECFAAELRVCGKYHPCLDDDHPVIYVGDGVPPSPSSDLNEYFASTGLLPKGGSA